MDCFKLDEVIYSVLEKGRKMKTFSYGERVLRLFFRKVVVSCKPLVQRISGYEDSHSSGSPSPFIHPPFGYDRKAKCGCGNTGPGHYMVVYRTGKQNSFVSFLLGTFAVFGSAPLQVVLSFPLSETFVLIVLSYLLSQGIENSG